MSYVSVALVCCCAHTGAADDEKADAGVGFTVTRCVDTVGKHPGLDTLTVTVFVPALVHPTFAKGPPVVAGATVAFTPKFHAYVIGGP